MNKQELMAAFTKEMTALTSKETMVSMKIQPVVSMKIQPVVAISIINQLQLALRHPSNNGKIPELMKSFINDLAAAAFHDCPAILEVIEGGFNGELDFIMI